MHKEMLNIKFMYPKKIDDKYTTSTKYLWVYVIQHTALRIS